MLNPVNQIINQTQNKQKDNLNILSFVSHERYEFNLSKIGHTFYSIADGETRRWNLKYGKIPSNYIILKESELPSYINFDLIITHNPMVHIPWANKIRQGQDIPIINVMHTQPYPLSWSKENTQQLKPLFDLCQYHVFITEFNQRSWFMQDLPNSCVISHGIDTEVFKPKCEKQPMVLTMCNDFKNRSWALGYELWENIISQIDPKFIKLVGTNPGLSQATNSIEEVIELHQLASIHLNCSLASPIPMVVLEAMASSCCVISTNTCALPDILTHEFDGFTFPPNKPEKFVNCIKYLLNNPNEAIKVGQNARETVKKMFSIERFVSEWKELIEKVIK